MRTIKTQLECIALAYALRIDSIDRVRPIFYGLYSIEMIDCCPMWNCTATCSHFLHKHKHTRFYVCNGVVIQLIIFEWNWKYTFPIAVDQLQ